jgi:hypothetical protein
MRCWQPVTEEFKAAIVQHHWQTRFYQQLSPVIAFVEMVQLGNCFKNGFLDMTPSGRGKPINSMGYDVSKAWMTRCWHVQSDTTLVEMATVDLVEDDASVNAGTVDDILLTQSEAIGH